MADPVTVGTGAAMALALATDAGKKLVGPLAESLGLAAGDLGDIYRFYQNDNLGKVFKKWGERRNQQPLTESEVRKVLPLLRLASEQSDDDLQTRWATLLEHSAGSDQIALPSFGQTLAQLTSDEAKFLERLRGVSFGVSAPAEASRQPGEMLLQELINLYDPSISLDIVDGPELTPKTASADLYSHAELVIDDLVRRGLMQKRFDAITTGGGYGAVPDTATIEWYSLSPYGRRFVQVVSPEC